MVREDFIYKVIFEGEKSEEWESKFCTCLEENFLGKRNRECKGFEVEYFGVFVVLGY